jgi:hypothetical protein
MKTIISAIIVAGALSQMANAMGPMGDTTHRHFYKDQEWIWQNQQGQPKVEGSDSKVASNGALQAPLASSVQDSTKLEFSIPTYLSVFAIFVSTETSVAFVPPTHPSVAFVPPTHPSVTFVPPTHPSVAFVPPTHPSVAFVPPTHPSVAFVPPTHPSVTFVPPTHPSVAFVPPTHPSVF